jgi:transposase
MKDTEKILSKILLPVDSDWEVTGLEVDESQESIRVSVGYKPTTIEDSGLSCPIYDHRKERLWRHLDLWQYKTYIAARVPRYIDADGKVKSVSVPWAEVSERLTWLLEKKR